MYWLRRELITRERLHMPLVLREYAYTLAAVKSEHRAEFSLW